MHYPFADGRGCGPSRGCLRVVAGSHRWGPERDAEFQEELQRRRVDAGLPATFSPLTASQPGADGRVDDMVEPTMPGEVTIALGPADLLVRRGSIYHCAHANSEDEGRLMQHWLFRAHDHFPNSEPRPATHAADVCSATDTYRQPDRPFCADHRLRWDDLLTDDLLSSLSQAQREVLWIGRGQELDPRFEQERERERGKVRWGVVEVGAKL